MLCRLEFNSPCESNSRPRPIARLRFPSQPADQATPARSAIRVCSPGGNWIPNLDSATIRNHYDHAQLRQLSGSVLKKADTDKPAGVYPSCPPQPSPRLDRVPPSALHRPCLGDHLHTFHFEVHQQPYPGCKCFNKKVETITCL